VRVARASRGTQLCRAKHLTLFTRKYRQMCIQLHTRLRRQVRRSPYLHLNLDLDLDLCPSPYRELFVKPYQPLFVEFFASSFAAMFESLFVQLRDSSRPPTNRQRPRGRRPVGRGVGGRIVVWF